MTAEVGALVERLRDTASVYRGPDRDVTVALDQGLFADLELFALAAETADGVADEMKELLRYSRTNAPGPNKSFSPQWKRRLIAETIVQRLADAVGYRWSGTELVACGPRHPHIDALVLRPPTGRVRMELDEFLLADGTNVGEVFRLKRLHGMSARAIAGRGRTPNYVWNAEAIIDALLDVRLPGGHRLPRQVAGKVRVATRWPGMSAATVAYLRALEELLEASCSSKTP